LAPSLETVERIGLILLERGFGSIRERMDWMTSKQAMAPPPLAGTPMAVAVVGLGNRDKY